MDVLQVRGLLIARGLSLARWSRANGFHHAYVHMSVRGVRRGPVARAIVKQLKQELGL
jgi:hypothetical protein